MGAAFLSPEAAFTLVRLSSNTVKARRCAPGEESVRSEEPQLGKRGAFPVADDEVVDEAHVDERERFGEALGDGAVGAARKGFS